MKKICVIYSEDKFVDKKDFAEKIDWFLKLLIEYGYICKIYLCGKSKLVELCSRFLIRIDKQGLMVNKVSSLKEIKEEVDSYVLYIEDESKNGKTKQVYEDIKEAKQVFIYHG